MNTRELDRAVRRLTPVELLKLSLLSATVFMSRLLRTWFRRIDRKLSRRLGRQLRGSGEIGERRDGEGFQRTRVAAAVATRKIRPEVDHMRKEEFSGVPDSRRLWHSSSSFSLSGKSLVPRTCCESCEGMAHCVSREAFREDRSCTLCPKICECPPHYAVLAASLR
ncbi:hypothetical protein KC19_VG044900 [Ceratodon purpureus]|uniref:Uncharacterized protein n=1 Tax=Ceratodon purpureus TaxID=3225 RepID=A0A8T0HM82_CERPU|nr:hypothetical protein KC19_VG044900 [Ceratodon purpureus]